VAGLKFTELPLKGAYTIDLDKREDDRGFFARYWCKNEFEELGLDTNIVQINNSVSSQKGTLRGLHYQRPPKAETKIVRCIYGSIFDVIVDIRHGSKTYGQGFGKELNGENRTMMYVPKGFAHGFQTMADNVELLYLHSEFYSKEDEGGLLCNDKEIAIDWPLPISEISERDKSHPRLNELEPIKL
jgi:dTDP-4-dehydrorhamnose 3,5-epimerase